MIKRWLPKDRILKRALYALLAFILFATLAGGLGAWDEYQHGWPEKGSKQVAEAVWQYGPASQEAANAIKQMGESTNPKELVALIDPATGKAVAAWPAELVGKKPDEMTLPSGMKLPALEMLKYREHFSLHPANDKSTSISVRVTPLYPWSGDENYGDGGRQEFKGEEGRFGGKAGRHGEWGDRRGEGRQAPGTQAVQAQPQAILLMAAPAEGVTVLRVLAGVSGALAAVAFILYWLSIAWWVFADARRRGSKAFAWGALTLLTNLVGAAVYLVARREQRNCTSCGSTVERSFNHCPHCGHGLKQVCAQCGHLLRNGWTHCANCGTPHPSGPADSIE